MKKILVLVFVMSFAFCVSAWAQETVIDEGADAPSEVEAVASEEVMRAGGFASAAVTCTNGNMTRVVEVTYSGQDGNPPCEVHYKKVTEQPGHDEILWNSEHTKDYCETKKQEFVEKIKSWGWDCK